MVAFSKFSGLALVASAIAHPGEKHDPVKHKRDLAIRDAHAQMGARSLAQCQNSAGAQALKQRSIQRRAETVKAIREKRGIKNTKRDLAALEAWEEQNHNMTGVSTNNMFTPIENVFDANTSCVLSPELTAGPYYVVGEYMRSNIKEAEHSEGVDIFLEVQYVDVSTCEGVPNVAVDVWNCNATGVYSGVSESSGQAGEDTTFLRGIQLTDHDGVVQFETIFPGHYSGRAIHTHLLSHMNATVQSNGTISVWNKAVSHIGQLFWPEDLRQEVEALEPYASNTVEVTTNDEDMWAPLSADESFDPFPQFVYLGDDVSDGLFAWIQIGINSSADYQNDEYYAVVGYLDAEGGHNYEGGAGIGGGSGGGAPSGGPSGAMPTGAAPTGAAPSS